MLSNLLALLFLLKKVVANLKYCI